MKTPKPLKPGRLPLVMLAVVAVWALFAVVMLTGTLLTTHQIDTRVRTINQVLPRVNHNLESLALAAQTVRVSGQIDATVKPVGPQFTQIVKHVNEIDGSAHEIAQRVDAINAGAQSINERARSINPLVVSIGASLASVRDHADAINGSVHGIDRKFGGILDHVQSIDDRLNSGNHRADTVRGTAGEISDDFVRLTKTLLPGIIQNSHAIAGSSVLHPLDAGRPGPLPLGRLVPVPRVPSAPLKPPAAAEGLLGTAGITPVPR